MTAVLAEPLGVGPVDVVPEEVVVAGVVAPPHPKGRLAQITILRHPEEGAHAVDVVIAVVVPVVDGGVDGAVGFPVGQIEVAVEIGSQVRIQVAVFVNRADQEGPNGVAPGGIEKPRLVVLAVAVAIDQQPLARRQGLDFGHRGRIEPRRFAEDSLEHRLLGVLSVRTGRRGKHRPR